MLWGQDCHFPILEEKKTKVERGAWGHSVSDGPGPRCNPVHYRQYSVHCLPVQTSQGTADCGCEFLQEMSRAGWQSGELYDKDLELMFHFSLWLKTWLIVVSPPQALSWHRQQKVMRMRLSQGLIIYYLDSLYLLIFYILGLLKMFIKVDTLKPPRTLVYSKLIFGVLEIAVCFTI